MKSWKALTVAAAPLAILISACAPEAGTNDSAEPTPAPTTTPAASASPMASYDDWIGKWTGPEGLFVTVTATGEGTYQLEMQSDLDTRGTYQGTAGPDGIVFERGGTPFSLRRATGDETGLKYLAGKQDCLMVVEGEGFCRD